MFLTNQSNGIEDFLKAVNFLTPNGMQLKYFVIPMQSDDSVTDNITNTVQPAGFEVESNVDNIDGVTDTMTYAKKDLLSKQSVSKPTFDVTQTPDQYPITKPITVANSISQNVNAASNGPTQPMKTDILFTGGEIVPPNSGVKIVESTDRFCDLMLSEAMSVLPKYTVLHFVKGQI